MRSLRTRLIALWVMLAASAFVTGFLLLQFYRQSANVQVAEAVEQAAQACRQVAERYAFFVSGWHGSEADIDEQLKSELRSVVLAALGQATGIEGGIWQSSSGSLAYGFPTYEGSGPKTDLPTAELSTIQQINADALANEHSATIRQSGESQVVILHACLLDGPIPETTAWTMTRVFTGQSRAYRQFIAGFAVLALTVLGSALWLGHILLGWSRKIARLEAALAAGDGGQAELPALQRSGERELDRLVDALNTTGQHLKNERQRAASAERLAAIGRLAAGLAHEIRNPIAAMRLKAENALAGDDQTRSKSALQAILDQVGRLDRLLRDLLTMTQRPQPNLVAVDLPAFLEEAAETQAELAASKGIALRLAERDQMPATARFDPEQIRRGLDNLILNAIQNTPAGGAIILSAAARDNRLRLRVANSGPGIPGNIRNGLFEPFVTGRKDGTGLGLAIVREIAHAHGGEARLIDGEHGATFEIELPWQRILIVDDDDGLRDGLAEAVSDLGHSPHTAATGGAALTYLADHGADAVLLDLRMPGEFDGIEVLRRIRRNTNPPPVAVLTAFASAENTIEAMRLGAFDHLTKPIGRDQLGALLQRMLQSRGAISDVGESTASRAEGTLIGTSDGMRRVQKTIGLAADSETTVLILGETGTGKELVARALHEHSRRKAKPFVAVNCAAIPSELLESELFGHVKGAFTGAGIDRSGAFRDANGGTLFLDEIGDMPLAMQAKILRSLQERVVTPVGGKPVTVDVRVVAATHRDLTSLVASGAFREDLFYRLNVLPIVLPPVRERLADIVPLAEHFLGLAARNGAAKRLSANAAARLLAHPWPGNVREIRNVIERANVLVRGEIVDAEALELASGETAEPDPGQWLDGDLPSALAKLEKAMIIRALAACGGNRAEAARRLNINRQLLYTKMQRYEIGDRTASESPTPVVGNPDSEAPAD